MIILRKVPLEKQAQFLHDNVCRVPDNPALDEALGEHGIDIAGLHAHRDLLRGIYADLAPIAGKDDKQRYLELFYTVAFVYAVFAFGTLVREDNRYSVQIDKALLKEKYKKGAIGKRVRHLEHHGFAVQTLSAEGEPASLSRAAHLSLTYEGHPALVRALKLFAERTEAIPESTEPVLYNKLGIFLKADLEAGILHKPLPRDDLDPLREDILATVAEYGPEWVDLVGRARERCGLQCSGFWHYDGSPSWGVSFFEKGKRPLLIFTLASGIVFVEFTLPMNVAERIIRDRQRYSELIRGRIESFGCVKCPKKCKGENLRKVDGVWLCSGRAEARRIYATLSSPEDFSSVHAMLDVICGAEE